MAERRPLTPGEIALARSMFGDAIDYARVRIVQGKWAFFQPRETVMAPLGHIHFHPKGTRWREDFAEAAPSDQALFIHEMTHVWQHQRGLFLPIARHPFCRYRYRFDPARAFESYGIEQQAEIVRHGWMLRQGYTVPGRPARDAYERMLPF